MTISIGGNDFGSIDTHQVPQYGDWEYRDNVQSWFGVRGESVIGDSPHGRDISIECDFVGFETEGAADQAIDGYAALVNQLSGTLTIALDSTRTIQNVMYKGLRRRGPTFFDALEGQWIASVILLFRQMKP
jgi:hypothetical protein